MCCKYTKPFLTYEEQLERIKNHYNLDVGNDDLCLKLLKSISYYDLINGYKDFFMEDETYKDNIKLEDIFKFILFEKDVQNLLFKYSVYVENTLKTRLSYVISKDFGVGVDEYLDERKYGSSSRRVINKVKKVIESDYQEKYLKHYKENHSHVPPWILFKSITFNNATDLYSSLKKVQKEQVLKEYFYDLNDYGKQAELFKSMIIIVRKFRNKIAHNYKFIGENITGAELHKVNAKSYLKYNLYRNKDLKKNSQLGKNDVFSMIVSLINLLENEYLAPLLTEELIQILKKGEILGISSRYIGYSKFPEDIIDRLKALLPNE